MSTRVRDVAENALAALNAAQQLDAGEFVTGVTRNFRSDRTRCPCRNRGNANSDVGNLHFLDVECIYSSPSYWLPISCRLFSEMWQKCFNRRKCDPAT